MGMGIFYARAAATLLLPIALSATHPAQAQDYPDRAVKIVVPFAAGGTAEHHGQDQCRCEQALRQPELQERLRKLSAETCGGSIEKTAKYLQEEVERWGNVIKAANVKLQQGASFPAGAGPWLVRLCHVAHQFRFDVVNVGA